MSRKTWLILAWIEVACSVANFWYAFAFPWDGWSWADLGFGLMFAGVAWLYFRTAAVTR